MRRIPRIAALLALLAAGSACAGRWPGAGSPSYGDCAAAAVKLNEGPESAGFRRALTRGGLARCGERGAVALAGALGRAGTIGDTALLDGLVVQASSIRHPLILQAALEVAADGSALPAARAAGMQVALRQYAAHVALPGGVAQLAVLDVGPFCRYDSLPGAGYASEHPLPEGHRETIIVTMKRIADDPWESAPMRDLAGCVARGVSQRER